MSEDWKLIIDGDQAYWEKITIEGNIIRSEFIISPLEVWIDE